VDTSALDVERLLSGQSGIVAGRRARLRGYLNDLLDDAALWSRLVPPRLKRAGRLSAPETVRVLGVYSRDCAGHMARSVAELERSHARVELVLGALDEPVPELAPHTLANGLRGGGKFQNLNLLLETAPESDSKSRSPQGEPDWTVVMDDDVELPRGFLDAFLFCARRFNFQLVQPALRRTSHAAWQVCRRERWSVARRTQMVEIGPLFAMQRSIAKDLLPFPSLRMGWGLDLHWGGLAQERGWRLGVVDALPIRHEARETASAYDRPAAIEELRAFLSDGRPHIDRDAALRVLERHRSWS
jgi:hypothetical protein